MSHFILGVLISLPCDDPIAAVEEVMQPFEAEGGKTDGWCILEMQWSRWVEATPFAYVDLAGNWHERATGWYPEECERDAVQRAIIQAHLAQYGMTHLEILRAKREAVPEAVTDWHRQWQQTVLSQRCIVAFLWCHV